LYLHTSMHTHSGVATRKFTQCCLQPSSVWCLSATRQALVSSTVERCEGATLGARSSWWRVQSLALLLFFCAPAGFAVVLGCFRNKTCVPSFSLQASHLSHLFDQCFWSELTRRPFYSQALLPVNHFSVFLLHGITVLSAQFVKPKTPKKYHSQFWYCGSWGSCDLIPMTPLQIFFRNGSS